MAVNQTFAVLPFVRNNRTNTGLSDVYIRITVDGVRAELSAKTSIEKRSWIPGKGRVKGTTEDARRYNNRIKSYEDRVKDAYDNLLRKGSVITAQAIKEIVEGVEHKKHGLLRHFNIYLEEIKAQIGNGYAAGTYKNWKATRDHLQEFIKADYKRDDLILAELSLQFANRFEIFAKAFWKCKNNAVLKHLQRIRKVIKRQVKLGVIDKDPLDGIEIAATKSKPKFLRLDELQAIENKKFSTERLQHVVDAFLFSCYTGLAYSDIQKLSWDHIGIGVDGKEWIFTSRIKTGNDSNIPLLPQAKAILYKYKDDPLLVAKGRALPIVSNIKTNEYLKEIAELSGIKKKLTFHMARHTFATTVTLTNGVPIETVSKMLGHKKLTTTQIYAHVLEIKVSNDMMALANKLAQQAT